MSNEAAPFLFLNVCIEAIFVTNQRLGAQSISSSKSSQILNDVVQTLCKPNRLLELFRPQETPTLKALMDFTETIVNSSIMTIRGVSMSKLCDLAFTHFKFQVMCSTRAEQILDITRTHLDGLDSIIARQESKRSRADINVARQRLEATFKGRGVGELHRIRQTVLRTLQDFRIKDAMLIDLQLQNDEGGAFLLPPPLSTRTGVVSYYNNGELENLDTLKVLTSLSSSGARFFDYPLPLGSNMYDSAGSAALVDHVDRHVVAPTLPARMDGEHFAYVTQDI